MKIFKSNRQSSKIDPNTVLDFVRKRFKSVGVQLAYIAVMMFYAYRKKETPSWAKNIILGSLGYLLAPIDTLPDLTPVLGFTDDFGVLSFGLVTISCYITSEIKSRAKEHMSEWFGVTDDEIFAEIDDRL